MKLSTLLLSSAALVVAGSAYAADLPAKKAAPAAKAAATGCPAFGAGFFQIPGGDTCIKFSGSVYTDVTIDQSAANKNIVQAADVRFTIDARNNTDAGVLRSVATFKSASTTDKAYVQLGGLSTGQQDAITKVYGAGLNQSGADYSNPSVSTYYSMPMGSATVAFGVANANNGGTDVAKNPDLQAAVTTAAGPVTLKVAIASHEARNAGNTANTQGYAVLGSAKVVASGVELLAFGGTATAASQYMTASGATSNVSDVSATGRSSSTSYGLQGSTTVSGATVGALYTTASATLDTTTYNINQTALFASFSPVKNFRIDPEYIRANKNGTNSDIFYIRIARDF